MVPSTQLARPNLKSCSRPVRKDQIAHSALDGHLHLASSKLHIATRCGLRVERPPFSTMTTCRAFDEAAGAIGLFLAHAGLVR